MLAQSAPQTQKENSEVSFLGNSVKESQVIWGISIFWVFLLGTAGNLAFFFFYPRICSLDLLLLSLSHLILMGTITVPCYKSEVQWLAQDDTASRSIPDLLHWTPKYLFIYFINFWGFFLRKTSPKLTFVPVFLYFICGWPPQHGWWVV